MKINNLKEKKEKAFNEILRVFNKYESQDNLYNFSDCFFQNEKSIIEFSKLIKKNEIKVLYLEYCNDRIDADLRSKNYFPSIIAEINKLKKIIEMETKVIIDPIIQKNNSKNDNVKKVSINLKKFKFQGTEKSILILIDLLYNSKFLASDDYKMANAILRDTFLNKDGKPFNNKQLSVTRQKIDKIKKEYLIKIEDDDFNNFVNLVNNLSKYIKN